MPFKAEAGLKSQLPRKRSTIPEATLNRPGNKEFTVVRITQRRHILGSTG